MSIYKKMLALDNKLICLSKTTDLEKTRSEEKWEWLKNEYRAFDANDVNATETRWILAVCNAILTQNRLVFCISRSSLVRLIKSDPQNETGIGFGNSKYPFILARLQELEIIKLVRAGSVTDKTPSIFEACEPSLLKFLENQNREAQIEDAVAFVSKRSRNLKDRGPDHTEDQESKNNRIVVRIESKDQIEDSVKQSMEQASNPRKSYPFGRHPVRTSDIPEISAPVSQPASVLGFKHLLILINELESDPSDDNVLDKLIRFYTSEQCHMEKEHFLDVVEFRFSKQYITQRLAERLTA